MPFQDIVKINPDHFIMPRLTNRDYRMIEVNCRRILREHGIIDPDWNRMVKWEKEDVLDERVSG